MVDEDASDPSSTTQSQRSDDEIGHQHAAESLKNVDGQELQGAVNGHEEDQHQEMFDEVMHKPIRVTEVEAKGFQRTKHDVVMRELEGVRKASTLEGVRDEMHEALNAFQELDVFSEVTVDVELPREDIPDACRVALLLEEKDIHMLKASTFVQSDEGGINGHLGIRNFFGHAEHFKLTGEWGSRKSMEYALDFTKPRITGLPWTLDVRLFNTQRSSLTYSSFAEQLRGVSVGLTSSGGMHRIVYELGWQHLTDPTNLASRPVQAQLGHKLKSSLSYNLMVNQLTPIGDRPEEGFAFRWSSELGGLHPHSQVLKFMKHRADLEVAKSILPWMSASLGLNAGFMLPVGEGYMSHPTNISDRFSLGGVGSLRGFQHHGCGPTAICRSVPHGGGIQRRDALGGDMLWSAKGALNFDIPITGMKAAGIYGQLFGNVGNMLLLSGTGQSLKQSWLQVASNYKLSIGLGLVWPLGPWGSLEVNYVLPLKHAAYDRKNPGFELGFASKIFSSA